MPVKDGSVKFLVIGDSGTGDREQFEVGAQIAKEYQRFKFEFAIMLGDNMYGGERPEDFLQKFEKPYKPLLDAGVKFYASLGNHDDPNQRFYKPFNMNGERYYTYTKGPVRFFVLDSNYMDEKQIVWLERELKASNDPWKISYFHHPLYSSGARHGSEVDLRVQLEPLFLKYGVSAVFAGTRTLLRTPSPAERHRLLHERRRRETAARQYPARSHDRRRIRHRPIVHARGD